MRIKTSKKKKVVFLTFCAFCAFYAFYAHEKHLSESRLFAFCAFCAFYAFCAFCAFCACETFSLKNKTAPIPSFILLLKIHPITKMIFFCNLFQLSQSFSIITIFFNLFTTCNTIFMKIRERMNFIV